MRDYYKMSVVDYIRTVKFRKIGKDIQQGMNCRDVEKRYGFRTHAGFLRAFSKEYPVPPTVYKNGIFETTRAGKYIKGNREILQMSILNLQPIQIKARKILQGNGRADTNLELESAANSSLEDGCAINLEGGHYAIFQTEVLFDDEAAADTLKLLAEAVIGGWMKDNSERVDETRFVFERFFDRKVYLYVPVKQSEILI